MRKLLAIALPFFTFSVLGSGAAHADAFPANNENACTSANGIYSQTGSGNSGTSTCTVEGKTTTTQTMAAGESGRGFTLVTVTPTTLYVKQQGTTTTTTVGTIETSCFNPGGVEVSVDIPVCQAS